MSLRINCGTKDDIIYINLGNKLVLTLVSNEQNSVSIASCKASCHKISRKTFIPCSWGLLETIQ